MAESESRFLPDFSKIPCFKNSFLTGIGAGLVVGFAAFMKTSNSQKSTRIGFFGYIASTLVYWGQCRYQYAQHEFTTHQYQKAIQAKLLIEGTELEKKFEEESKNV